MSVCMGSMDECGACWDRKGTFGNHAGQTSIGHTITISAIAPPRNYILAFGVARTGFRCTWLSAANLTLISTT